jgi:hypothetical protein
MVNWDDNIKHFFTQMDIGCMRSRNIDLSDYSAVKDNADKILFQLTEHVKNPNRGMPKGGRAWPPGKIKDFEDWMKAGFPKSKTDPGPPTS